MAGVTSRRKADELIAAGRVTVNGEPVHDLGTRVDPSVDEIYLDGRQIVVLDPKMYILLNKPRDTITTLNDEWGRSSVRDYVGIDKRIYPVGRLDRHTTGVLILTNDGDFANAMMHPRNKVRKTYLVTLDRPVAPEDLIRLATGIRLAEGRTAPAQLGAVPGTKNCVVEITIHEGRNRQVHRMFESVGYEVRKLDRVAYGTLTYEGVPRGRWRHLLPAEVRGLLAASTEVSPKAGPAPPPRLSMPGQAGAGKRRQRREQPPAGARASSGKRPPSRAASSPGRRRSEAQAPASRERRPEGRGPAPVKRRSETGAGHSGKRRAFGKGPSGPGGPSARTRGAFGKSPSRKGRPSPGGSRPSGGKRRSSRSTGRPGRRRPGAV